jgi:hypothetical protein
MALEFIELIHEIVYSVGKAQNLKTLLEVVHNWFFIPDAIWMHHDVVLY